MLMDRDQSYQVAAQFKIGLEVLNKSDDHLLFGDTTICDDSFCLFLTDLNLYYFDELIMFIN